MLLALALALTASAGPATQPRPASPREPPALPTVEAMYEHDLATPNGVVPLTWPALTYDRANRELFVVAEGFVRIFDDSGMEVHRFGDDGSLGHVSRVAVLEDGDVLVAASQDGRRTWIRCDYRGEPKEPFGIRGLPVELAGFEPDLVVQRNRRLYFAERGSMRVVMTDLDGTYRQAYQIRDLVMATVPPDADIRGAPNMDAFAVDGQGNLLFTMSAMFAGGVVAPNGGVRLFGSRGSRPGKFNIIGGIDADEQGNVYVTDRLRSVVSVWDRELHHLDDFGYRGTDPSNLLTPYEIAVGNGRVFVAQAGQKGVKVFRVRLVEPPPPPPPPAPAPEARPPPGKKAGP